MSAPNFESDQARATQANQYPDFNYKEAKERHLTNNGFCTCDPDRCDGECLCECHWEGE